MEVRIKLPLFKSREETEKMLKLLYSIELFKEGVISVEKATEIAEIPYQDFLMELKKRGISAFQYDDEEAADELGL